MNNLSDAKRPKVVTEKFEMLSDLCTHFDKFSGSQRKENLIRYLKSFANRDSVPVKIIMKILKMTKRMTKLVSLNKSPIQIKSY